MNEQNEFEAMAEAPEFADNEPTELPFPTIPHQCWGETIEEYVIPDNRRAEVLDLLYPFYPVPGLDETWMDIHENRPFRIRDYKVVKERGHLWLVSPHYFSSGGSVIDWMPILSRSRHRPA